MHVVVMGCVCQSLIIKKLQLTYLLITILKVVNSESRNRINYPRRIFERTLKENIVLKHERIRITIAGEDTFRATDRNWPLFFS